MKELHDQGNLQKKAFNLGFIIPEDNRVHDHHVGKHGSGQAGQPGTVHDETTMTRQREGLNGPVMNF